MSTALSPLAVSALPSVMDDLAFISWKNLPQVTNNDLDMVYPTGHWGLELGATQRRGLHLKPECHPTALTPDTTSPSFWVSSFLYSVDEAKAEPSVLLAIMALLLMSPAVIHCSMAAHSSGTYLKERLNRKELKGVQDRCISCQVGYPYHHFRAKHDCTTI